MASQADKIISIASAEVGYLEKKSNSQLYDKTANAGKNNYTKYGAWYNNGSLQANPWCDMFVSWCADQAGVLDKVGNYAYCPSHVNYFKNKGQWYNRGAVTPKKGWVIFFKNSGSSTAAHVGLVESVSGGYVNTIEGNTSNAATLVPNGGGVFRKKYSLTSTYILGYGAPAYTDDDSTSDSTPSTPATTTTTESWAATETYKNGSTDEIVYSDTTCKLKVGTLNPYESCTCYGKLDGTYVVSYKVDGTSYYKAGVAKYKGKTTGAAVSGGKAYKNGSTSEPVYMDSRKNTKIGSLNPYESCLCLAKLDGMYLVRYKIDGTSHYKVGFCEYNGGI